MPLFIGHRPWRCSKCVRFKQVFIILLHLSPWSELITFCGLIPRDKYNERELGSQWKEIVWYLVNRCNESCPIYVTKEPYILPGLMMLHKFRRVPKLSPIPQSWYSRGSNVFFLKKKKYLSKEITELTLSSKKTSFLLLWSLI